MNPFLSRHRTTWVDVALAMRRRAMLYAWLRLTSGLLAGCGGGTCGSSSVNSGGASGPGYMVSPTGCGASDLAPIRMTLRPIPCWVAPGSGRTPRRGLSRFLLPLAASVIATLLNLGLVAFLFESSGMQATQQQTHATVAGLARVTG